MTDKLPSDSAHRSYPGKLSVGMQVKINDGDAQFLEAVRDDKWRRAKRHPDAPKTINLKPFKGRGRGRSTLSPVVLQSMLRGAKALEMRQAGKNLDEIAKALGYATTEAVGKLIRRSLDRLLIEPSEAVRDIELTRLDRLLASIWDIATNPESKNQFRAIDRVLAIMRQRAELTGINQVKSMDMTVWIRQQAESRDIDPIEVMEEVRIILASVE